MRTFALIGIFVLACILVISANAASQEMELHGNVYDSDGTDVTNVTDAWVGIYIDADQNEKYEEYELYDTNNTYGQMSTVEWNDTSGGYSLQLQQGDPGWARSSDYKVLINGSEWYDGNTTCHEHLSTAIEFTIPSEETEHENDVDIQTRFMSFKINEFLYDDDGDDDDEWIEIFNPTNLTRSIDFWTLDDNDTSEKKFRFDNLPDVPGYSYIVVHWANGANETSFGQSQTDALHIYTDTYARWANGEDQIILHDSYGLIVDFVAYCGDGTYNTGDDDHEAVEAGIWFQDDYVNTAGSGEDDSVGLEYNGVDTDKPDDWIVFTSPSSGESNVQGTPIPELPIALTLAALIGFLALFRRTGPGRR